MKVDLNNLPKVVTKNDLQLNPGFLSPKSNTPPTEPPHPPSPVMSATLTYSLIINVQQQFTAAFVDMISPGWLYLHNTYAD